MNRADQAPEPSMEELLASIRLIISDADRNGPEKGPVYAAVPAADAASAGRSGMANADEVFDLTDDFPEAREASPAAQGGRLAAAGPDDALASQMRAASRRAEPSNPPSPPTAAQTAPAPLERQKQSPPPVTRPIWSGRELQPAGATSQHAAPKLREESIPARPQAKNWAADIQLPIPEQGPVSLFSASAAKEPEAGAGGEEAEGTVAVAALAQRLARSAIGVLEASELETANQVDFEHLDADSKTEVLEKFADAIERESVAQGAGALTAATGSAIAEVRKRESLQSAPLQDPMAKIPAQGHEAAALPEAEVSPNREAKSGPVRTGREPEPERPSRPGNAPQYSQRHAPANPVPAPPLAHAQFAGHAQLPVPAQTGKTLEDAVREMLRPLLVQWLNENMPRILENAIREEIAARGRLPKSSNEPIS